MLGLPARSTATPSTAHALTQRAGTTAGHFAWTSRRIEQTKRTWTQRRRKRAPEGLPDLGLVLLRVQDVRRVIMVRCCQCAAGFDRVAPASHHTFAQPAGVCKRER
jgi:hypothetical protein